MPIVSSLQSQWSQATLFGRVNLSTRLQTTKTVKKEQLLKCLVGHMKMSSKNVNSSGKLDTWVLKYFPLRNHFGQMNGHKTGSLTLGTSCTSLPHTSCTGDMALDSNSEIWFRLAERQASEYMLMLSSITWLEEVMMSGKATETEMEEVVHTGELKSQLVVRHSSLKTSCSSRPITLNSTPVWNTQMLNISPQTSTARDLSAHGPILSSWTMAG